jgi:hypothetical protein
MPPEGRRWYLSPELRPKLKQLIEAYDGSYRGVGRAINYSYASVHRLATGITKSSSKVPDLLKLFDLDVAENLALSDEQLAWLDLLEDIQRAGKDPVAIENSIRQLANIPATKSK